MTLVSNKTIKKIFLTTNTRVMNIVDRVSLIISPEFYWVRKFEIPVKTETQAKYLLPTLFEDIIKEDSPLTYQAVKLEDNSFICFAYSDKKIYEAIKKANIPISNIASVHFAQNECKSYDCFEIDRQVFMYTKDDILVKVPSDLIDDPIDLTGAMKKIKLSSPKLQIKLYNNFLNTKFYYSIFAVFAILILINIFKYADYSREISKLNKNIESIKNVNKLPSSSIQTKNILSKYNNLSSKEKKKREAISYIFANNEFNLKSLSIKNETISLEYLSANKSKVERFLRKKFKKINTYEKEFLLKVSIKL